MYLFMLLLILYEQSGMAAEWTLGQTVERAQAVSGAVRIEELSATEAALDAETARTRWYPQVAVGAEARVVSDVMELDMPLGKISFGDYDSYDFTLSVTQTLYDGGRLSALRAVGGARARMNRSNADAARLGVVFHTKASFFRVIMSEKLLEAAEQSRDEAGRHLLASLGTLSAHLGELAVHIGRITDQANNAVAHVN